ncbi:MAG: galactose mutarotase [Lentisphaeria bacterium]|nr:galactose mutarotase [Lentisphaeria bacterium]
MERQSYGVTPDGRKVDVYTMVNANGVGASVITYGAILVSLEAPDRDGVIADVTLGFDDLDGYAGKHPYFGATVGRFANRIAKATFALDGVEYKLAANDGENHLHGGQKGFDKEVWEAEPFEKDGACGVVLCRTSVDGEENYPGTLRTTATYTLTADDGLHIVYEAVTDKPTPLNMTNHAYFNLDGGVDIIDHVVQIFASSYTPVNDALIPTGEVLPVAGTPLDFTVPHAIRERIGQVPAGYDHSFVLDKTPGELALAARVVGPKSGRVLEVLTTEPATQLYTGNFLDGTLAGKAGCAYLQNGGFCLEPQKYPDSPNQPDFPSCILRPGETYRHEIVFRMSVTP